MKIDVKKTDKNKVQILVEIPKDLVDSYFQTAAETLSKDLKVKGFRPGKMPVDVVEKEVGSQKLYNQTINTAIQKTLPGIITKRKIEVIGQPEIAVKKISKGDSLIYQATFQLIPEIKLGKYKGLKIEKKDIKVEEGEVKKSLDYLQNSRAKTSTVNRPAKKGDRVEVDFEIRQGGTKVENGESKNHPIVLGNNRFLPGFEEKIEGLKTGENKEFSLKAPDNWPDKKIAGRKLDFKVKMSLVQKREKPVLNDEFAKSLGQFGSLDALKESIRKGLKKEKEEKEKQKIRIGLIEKVAQDSEADIPDVLIEQEKNKMLEEFKRNIAGMGLSFDKYLKEIDKNVQDLKKDWQKQAEKRIKIALCLKAIADKENINVSDEEIEQKINEDLKKYPDPEKAKKDVDLNRLKEYTKNILRNQKVFDLLEKEAKIV